MSRVVTLLGVAALSIGAWGCDSDPVGQPDGFPLDRVTIEGRVLAGGEPLSRAVLTLRVFPAGCQGDPLLTLTDLTPDLDGSFSQTVAVLATGETALRGCIEVLVTPLSGTGLEATTAQIDPVQFVRTPGAAPTVEVEITVD